MASYLRPMCSISYLYQYVHKLATKRNVLVIFIACLVSKQSDIYVCNICMSCDLLLSASPSGMSLVVKLKLFSCKQAASPC